MAQVNYPNQIMQDLTKVILENGTNEIGLRLQQLVGKSKVDIVNGLETIISEIKSKDLKCDNATKDTIKHVYRKIVS